MTTLAEILADRTPICGGFQCRIPADWMQGRTCFGGLSSAIALQAALLAEPDLPPLRSAQIGFVGPLAGEVNVTALKLRRGRNAAFLQADVASEAGLGLRAMFVFMRDQPSAVDLTAPTVAHRPPPQGTKLWSGPEGFFAANMEFYDPKFPGLAPAELMRWGRMKAHEGLDPFIHVVTMADALPPAPIRLLNPRTPLSSLTWQINLLTPSPATTDGWWLIGAKAEHARGGGSSQMMRLWNADGVPIAEGTQSVALFG
jgi:acyl-CoA thioesterase